MPLLALPDGFWLYRAALASRAQGNDMTVEIIQANALALPLPDASVDLIVTSPPYFGLRSYQDGGKHYEGQLGDEPTPAEFVDALIAATREMMRVVKPTGSIWLNLGDKYATAGTRQGNGDGIGDYDSDRTQSARHYMPKPAGIPTKSLIGVPWRYALRCIDDLGLILRAEVIWSKPNGLPESVTDRVRRSHETWFHFTLQPRYFSGVDEIREPHAEVSLKRAMPHRANVGRAHEGTHEIDMTKTCHPLGKLPGSVWTIPTQPLIVPDELGIDHFAAFPMEWPRRIISGWCPDGGTVLDPFGGTGTTALVAHALDRHGISVDLSSDYCRLARWRTTDPAQIAKAAEQPKPQPIPDGQMELKL